jgi:hypothetical protein
VAKNFKDLSEQEILALIDGTGAPAQPNRTLYTQVDPRTVVPMCTAYQRN